MSYFEDVEIKNLTSGYVLAINADGSILASQAGTWNITNISGTISLPTGAATEATLLAVKTDTDKFTFAATRLLVDGSGVTQPISAASLPLPTGAATAAKQDTGNTSLSSIDGKITTTVNGIKVDGSAVTQPVSASSLPLPTGASTSANQTNGAQKTQIVDASNNVIGSTSNALDVNVKSGITLSVDLTQANDSVLVYGNDGVTNRAIKTDATGKVIVDGSGVTQPVSGTITANAGTGNFTVVQGTGTNLHAVIDSGTITVGNATLAVTQSGTWNINNISGTISLPTGASTAAKQPALGVAGTPSADVITVQGIASMTALKVDGSAVTQPVSGTVTANAGTGTFTVGQATGTNLHTVVDSGTITTITNVVHVDDNAGSLTVDGTITANAGTGTFTTQDTSSLVDNAGFTDGTSRVLPSGYILDEVAGTALTENDVASARIDSKRAQVLVIEDATTRGQRATVSAAGAVKIDGSAVTQPVSGTVTSNIGTTNGLMLDATFTGRINTQGQKTMAASTPVVIASDQGAVPASQSGTWNITNVSGTVSLPTGASTEASLAKLTIAQGAAIGANTQAMVGGSVTTAAPTYTTGQISPLNLTTGGALRTDMASWVGSTAPTVGQKTMANSVPVVIASDQSGATIITSPADGTKATYSAAITGLAMAATPTDVFTIAGSATKTIRVTRIYLTGTQTTGNTSSVLLIKRSTADTAGTSTTPAVVTYDTNNAAGTAVVRAYTANPTLGTTVGTIASYAMFIPAAQPANGNSPFISPDIFAAIRPAQAIVLRGTAQVLAINFNSVTVTGNSMNIFIEWTEE